MLECEATESKWMEGIMKYLVRTTLVEIEGDEETDIAACDGEEHTSMQSATSEFEELTGETVSECSLDEEDDDEGDDLGEEEIA